MNGSWSVVYSGLRREAFNSNIEHSCCVFHGPIGICVVHLHIQEYVRSLKTTWYEYILSDLFDEPKKHHQVIQ